LNPAGNTNSDSGAASNNNYPSASSIRNGNFGVVNSGYSSNNNYNNINSAMGYNSNAKASTIAALNPTVGGMGSLNPSAALNMPISATSRFGRLAQFGVMGSSSSGTAQTVSGAIPGYSSGNSANVGPSSGFGRHKF